MQQQSVNLTLLYPELVIAITLGLVLVVDLFVAEKRRAIGFWISLIGCVVALGFVIMQRGFSLSTFNGGYVVNDFSTLAKAFFLLVAIAVLCLSSRYVQENGLAQGEYYFLLLTAFLGCLLMPSVRDLLMLFIAIELVSVPGFLMAAFRKKDPRSNEAGLKFFLIGVLSSAIMLYGMSMIYGITGTLNLAEISAKLAGHGTPIVIASVMLVVVGFGFKVSAVPFHFWAPDTYEGSPVPVTAFLSVASKAAGFTGLLILMSVGFGGIAPIWTPLFAVLAVVTMTYGNLVALRQTQVVRMMAYSSIAQAGYMMVPLALFGTGAATDSLAFSAVFLYIMIYSVMTLGIFAVAIAVSREAPSLLLKDFSGIVKRSPWLGVGLVVCLVSLAGVPPTAGFFGKLLIFNAAIAHGGRWALLLAIVMVINSVISVGYYFKVVKQATLRESTRRERVPAPFLVSAVASVAMFLVLLVGIYPDLFAKVTQSIVP